MPRKSKQSNKSKKKAPPTTAVHAKITHGQEQHHIVGLGNIRVLLISEDKSWFAQGLEIDYAAQGDTLEEAKREFEDGLDATIHEHLRIHGNIEQLLVVAPHEFWALAGRPDIHLERFTTVSAHCLSENTKYEGIDYLIAAAQSDKTANRPC